MLPSSWSTLKALSAPSTETQWDLREVQASPPAWVSPWQGCPHFTTIAKTNMTWSSRDGWCNGPEALLCAGVESLDSQSALTESFRALQDVLHGALNTSVTHSCLLAPSATCYKTWSASAKSTNCVESQSVRSQLSYFDGSLLIALVLCSTVLCATGNGFIHLVHFNQMRLQQRRTSHPVMETGAVNCTLTAHSKFWCQKIHWWEIFSTNHKHKLKKWNSSQSSPEQFWTCEVPLIQ